MPDEPVELVTCASYTHARRHPMVLGRIAGWTPPFQLSLTQIGVLLVSFFVMVKTWWLWAEPLPGSLALVMGAGVPIALTWAVRRVRVEGRSLVRAAVGWVWLWCTPHKGSLRGRPYRERPAVSLAPVRMSVAAEVVEHIGPVEAPVQPVDPRGPT
jgi:hypothetical protein